MKTLVSINPTGLDILINLESCIGEEVKQGLFCPGCAWLLRAEGKVELFGC